MPPWPNIQFLLDFILPALLLVVGVFLIRLSLRKYRFKPHPKCFYCRYDLRTNPNFLSCPECGATTQPRSLLLHGQLRPAPLIIGLTLLLPALPLLFFLIFTLPWVKARDTQIKQAIARSNQQWKIKDLTPPPPIIPTGSILRHLDDQTTHPITHYQRWVWPGIHCHALEASGYATAIFTPLPASQTHLKLSDTLLSLQGINTLTITNSILDDDLAQALS
jgi:hypothetical protein